MYTVECDVNATNKGNQAEEKTEKGEKRGLGKIVLEEDAVRKKHLATKLRKKMAKEIEMEKAKKEVKRKPRKGPSMRERWS